MEERVKKPKSTPKLLKVVFEDGSDVYEKTATETYVKAIQILGPYEISKIEKIKVEGLPLVVTHKDYRMQLCKVDDNWYVATHMATDAKKRMLEKVAKALGKEIVVTLIQQD